MDFLYEKLDAGRAFATFLMPKMIKPNLNPAFELRPYQERAFENFASYFDGNNILRSKPSQVLFHMATGSGKTLIMAGLILYLYKKGYRDFLFFVNLSNIVQKTKENFLNGRSSKYLFANEINIDGETIPIREVSNFQDSDPSAINICFTTTQGLHSNIWSAKEDAITFEDFADRKIVLISDEAHHLKVDTRRMSAEESESYHSWEETVKKIFKQNQDNILLEFTATCDLGNPNIKAEYLDKIIFNYPLSEFRKDKYSKEIMTMCTDVQVMDRALLATVMSQYRLKVFQEKRISVKPVILFKAKTIAESKNFMGEFIDRISKLQARDLGRLATLTDNKTLQEVFAYFKKKGLSYADLAQELRVEFSKEHCISANDEKEADEWQLALNSLEDDNNPYRAIFEVRKLDEGWDVLNLFDIVRLYETRQSSGRKISPTTIGEAQLIGRGSRYFPFVVAKGQERFRRKYDEDATNPLRVCEQLYYHCQVDSRYVAELKNALKDIGADLDKSVTCDYRLKDSFKRDDLYKSGVVFLNEQIEKSRKSVKGISDAVKSTVVEYKGHTGSSQVVMALGDTVGAEDVRSVKTCECTIAQLAKENYAFVWKPMSKFPVLRFDNLKTYFPNLKSTREFIASKEYIGGISLKISATEISPAVKCSAVEQALAMVSETITNIEKEYEGSKDFKSYKISQLISDKTCVYTDPDIATEGLGVSQNGSTRWKLDLTKEDWFAFEDNFGTTEEKSFVLFFKNLVDKLKSVYSKVWLVRNERQVGLYSFKDGKRFEPDYIIFLKRNKSAKRVEQIQIFVEPKGTGYIATDQWKEDFLLQLEKNGHPVFKLAEGTDYRIVGCHFYNEEDLDRRAKVRDEILGFCGSVGKSVLKEIGDKLKYLMYLPLYSMKASCGKFGNQEVVEELDWMKVSGVTKKNKNLFIVRADGKSMEPKIKDGDYCVFEYRDGACDNNDIVLVQHSDLGDENMGAYTIKKLVCKKKGANLVSVRLVPINSDYDEIKLKNEGRNVRKFRVVGVLRKEIKVDME